MFIESVFKNTELKLKSIGYVVSMYYTLNAFKCTENI